MVDKIGENSCLLKCKDCGRFFHFLEGDKWCESCFDIGLQRDMGDHFRRTIEVELLEPEPLPQKEEV